MLVVLAPRRLELLGRDLGEIQFDPVAESHHGLLVQFVQSAQRLRTQLMEMQTGLDAVEKLIGPQAAHGHRPHQLLERLLAQAEEDIGKLHLEDHCTD